MTTQTPVSPLADLYDTAQAVERGAAPASLTAAPPPLSFWNRLTLGREARTLEKSVYTDFLKAQKRSLEAAAQGTVVAPGLETYRQNETSEGVAEPTGFTYESLRRFAHICEPAAAIHTTRLNQIAAFSVPRRSHRGYIKEPGFRIVMTDPDARTTPADKEAIARYTQFFAETGWCEPPVHERPIGWQPGFEPFLRQIGRDRLTLDWLAVRTWESAVNRGKYPIVTFAAVDAARIRNQRREVVDVKNFEQITREIKPTRTNTKREITLVRVEPGSSRKVEEYTDAEMFTGFARPRTDENANGYGYSELEQAVNAITTWCAARDYNKLRFDKDGLPRGVLTVLGNLSQQQFQSFQTTWKNMMRGAMNRWNIPILQGAPSAGSSVNWLALDPSQRDMEYSQFTFTVGLWLHCLYSIHPDETGFSASSPFRPPLSEASPESNLKYSQDTGLTPLLRFIEGLMNRKLLWRMEPSRRYTFEFVGLGDYNEMDDINAAVARLNGGLSTPAQEWNDRDIEMPKEIREHPAANFPAPFVVGVQTLQGIQQQGQQAQQAASEQAQAGQQQAAQQQQDGQNNQLDQQRQEEEHARAEELHDHNMNIDERKMALEEKTATAKPTAGAPLKKSINIPKKILLFGRKNNLLR